MANQPYTQLVLPAGKRPMNRFTRFVRAVWRDSSALLGEFYRPLLAFVIAVFGGGFAYHWLMGYAGIQQPPLLNMPYIMVALMILETPLSVPDEPYLMVFWYIMPVVALYVVGSGVTNFVRLFFNRNERRDAWEEAVASTYRNHIIVMGAGHVGMRITRTLVQMGFEVVMIDQKITPELDSQLNGLRVPAIVGDGRDSAALEKAGLPYADAFVICTSNDQINLEAIMAVRDISADIRIVARMWDSRFTKQIKNFMGVNVVLSASDLAAPVFAGSAVGVEVAQTITVHGKEYSMVRMTVEEGSFLDGRKIGECQHQYDIDIVLHGRKGEVDVHPPSDMVLSSGDTIVVFSMHEKITELVARNRRTRR